jgi:hypothetical protein
MPMESDAYQQINPTLVVVDFPAGSKSLPSIKRIPFAKSSLRI